MLFKRLFVTAASALVFAAVNAQVDGPFSLYITSEDPAWNNRYISIAARTPYMAVLGSFGTDPANIPASAANFFIDPTNVLGGIPGQGQLIWGAQPPFSTLYYNIQVTQPSSNLQPLFGQQTSQAAGYSTQWGFLPDGTLHLGGLTDFVGLNIIADRFGGDVVEWQFGTGTPSNTFAVPVQIKRHPA